MPVGKWIQNCDYCGSKLEFAPGENEVTCAFCRRSVERIRASVDVADLIAKGNERIYDLDFEKAQALFIEATYADPQSIEAIWGQLRCRYGVELLYEDTTDKRFLVCHKHTDRPITEDPLYRYMERRIQAEPDDGKYRQYLKDAKDIESEWREHNSLLEQNARPYDVFLCYKETDRYIDESGRVCKRPSQDREWVAKFYRELVKALEGTGLRVFYAPEALKALVGIAYAASISYALSTARVLFLIVGDKTYIQEKESTWVSSEWKRFYQFKESERLKRKIVPVLLRNLRPEELPVNIPRLQAIIDRGDMADVVEQAKNAINDQIKVRDPLDHYRWRWASSEYERLEIRFRNLSQEQALMSEKYNVERQRAQEYESSREKSEKTIIEQTSTINVLKQQAMENAAKAFNLTERVNGLERSKNQLSERVESLEAENRKLQETEQKAQQMVAQRDTEVRLLKEQLAEAQRSARAADAKAVELQEQLRRATSLNNNASNVVSTLEHDKQELESKLNAQRTSLEASKQEAEQLRAQIDKLKQTPKAQTPQAKKEVFALGAYGFGTADGTVFPENLAGVAKEERSNIDRIYFRLLNQSTEAQSNVRIQFIDTERGLLNREFKCSFGPRKSSPFYIEVDNPASVNRSFRVVVTDRRGTTTEVGTLTYSGK